MLRAFLLILWTGVSLCGCGSQFSRNTQAEIVTAEKLISPLFDGEPRISPNPQRRVPLVAIVDVTATTPVIGELEISDGINTWTISGPKNPKQRLRLIAHSMRPDREHKIRVRLTDLKTNNSKRSEPLHFKTQPLPKSFPPLEITLSDVDRVEPGITLFPVNLWKDDESIMDYGYLIAVNERGEVVWFLRSGHRTADVRLLKNGNILFQHGNYRYAFEIDLTGNLIRQWHSSRLTDAPSEQSIPVDVDTLHHEIAEHPNGNLFTLSTDLVRFNKFPTSVIDPGAGWRPAHVVCDQLIEFVPATGKVVRRFELKETLDQKRFGYLSRGTFWKPKYKEFIEDESRDWSHANGFVLLPEEDAVIISFRHLDCLIKYDLKKEEIIWVLGAHDGWGKKWRKYLLTPVGENFKWPHHQHGPQLTSEGHIRLYDNGNYQARPFQKPLLGSETHSRIVEFAIDEKKKTVRQTWEYDGAPDDPFFCPFYGEADLMSQTGNYLITDGGHIELEDGTPFNEVPAEHQWARIFEITGDQSHEKVFELKCESPLKSSYGWSIYRSMKLKSLTEINVALDLIPETLEDKSGTPASTPPEEINQETQKRELSSDSSN